jgi:cytoskeletal protein CcmA (bactofilin family)
MTRIRFRGAEDRTMAGRADDLEIPMSPIGRMRARVFPLHSAEPLTTPFTPPLVVEMPGTGGPSGSDPSPPASSIQQTAPPIAPRDYEVDVRTLIVGPEVSLSGELSFCDRLLVEGTVHAKIEGCENLMIAETGEFGGYASAENVDVRGRFEGDLVARKRLLIRSTGQVSGRITYQEIEMEGGAQISGQIHALGNDGGIPDRDTRRRLGWREAICAAI